MNTRKNAAVTELTAFYVSAKRSDQVIVAERDFYSLSYRYSGSISVEANGERLISEEGSMTFIPKGLGYKTEILEDMRMAVVHFKLAEDVDFRNASVVEADGAGISLLFEKLIYSARPDNPVDFRAMASLYELLARLDELSGRENAHGVPEKIRLARKSMERRYNDPALSVASVADSLGVSASYLRREFSRAYGASPIAFLQDVRVSQAKNMLESGVLSVGEIAEQCGFASPAYFIQVFHKRVGTSPDRYRRGLVKKE